VAIGRKINVVQFFEESGENRRFSSTSSDSRFVDKHSMLMISGFFQKTKKSITS
jgi:phosphopantothenoylcysteine synthetase/decarboxylase